MKRFLPILLIALLLFTGCDKTTQGSEKISLGSYEIVGDYGFGNLAKVFKSGMFNDVDVNLSTLDQGIESTVVLRQTYVDEQFLTYMIEAPEGAYYSFHLLVNGKSQGCQLMQRLSENGRTYFYYGVVGNFKPGDEIAVQAHLISASEYGQQYPDYVNLDISEYFSDKGFGKLQSVEYNKQFDIENIGINIKNATITPSVYVLHYTSTEDKSVPDVAAGDDILFLLKGQDGKEYALEYIGMKQNDEYIAFLPDIIPEQDITLVLREKEEDNLIYEMPLN